jgi:hypothetical protein
MSNPTGGHTGQLSPDAVKTGIDAVMYERFQRSMQPQYLSASDEMFFKQDTTDLVAFIWDEDSNVGEFDETAEQEEITNTDTFIGNTKTKYSQKYTKQVPISDEAFRADKVGKRSKIGSQIGDRARQTQDKKAILTTYGDAFAGSINTTPDGQALASNSHTTLKGVTVDNLETAALTPDGAWTLTVALASQKGQDGDAGSHVLGGALVPFVLYKTCKEVLNSSLIANSAENNLNIFDTDYGEVQIRASIFLGSAFNSASNANTSYHFIGENHQITRKVFYELVSTMIPPEYSDNDSWVMRSKFHESTFPGTWTAYAGSNGTTA